VPKYHQQVRCQCDQQQQRHGSVLPERVSGTVSLIATCVTAFKVYPLPGGSLGYKKGGCISFEKKNFQEYLGTLPRRIKDSPVMVPVRRSSPKLPKGHQEFKVRRQVITNWLLYLVLHHPENREVVIDFAELSTLPMDGDVVNRIKLVYEEDSEKEGSNDEGEEEEEEEEEDELEDEAHSPDQCSARGMPLKENDLHGDYVVQPLQPVGNEEDEVKEFLIGTKDNSLPFPDVGESVSESKRPGLQSAVFPHLFPNGSGDFTRKDRRVEVKPC
jgi:hypothetical protein